MGANTFLGKINGEDVPKLGEGPATSQIRGLNGTGEYQGQYCNQVAFFWYNSRFYKWDCSATRSDGQGGDWVQIGNNEAIDLFERKSEFDGSEEKEEKEALKFVAYQTALEPKPVSVRFPDDVATGDMSDYVIFDFFDYQPPFRGNETFGAELNNKLLDTNYSQLFNNDENYRIFNNLTLDQYNRTATSAQLYTRDTSGKYPQIALYMPSDVQDAYKADWEGKAFGTTSSAILSNSAAEGFVDKIKNFAKTSAKGLEKAPTELAASLISNLAKGITGDAISSGDVFGGISGVVRNPNVEVLFQKMNLRTFDHTFKLTPFTAGESNNIKKICDTFKKALLPRYYLGADDSVLGSDPTKNEAVQASFIKVPKVCQVTYMQGSGIHPYLPKYKMCAITDVNVNYTPDGNYSRFTDGAPTAVELRVSFMETKLVFAEDLDPSLNALLESDESDETGDNTDNNGMYMRSSDVRLKENITKVGNSPSGINIYEWNYVGKPQKYRGVLAQEIMMKHPDAVDLMPNGYLGVYYGKIDVKMEKV